MNPSNWQKPGAVGNGTIKMQTEGFMLVSGNKEVPGDVLYFSHTYEDVENICSQLPEELKKYTHECIAQHRQIVDLLLANKYEPVELCFRDYLSGPRNEISGNSLDLLEEAWNDDRYELVPTIIFENSQMRNPDDDIADTSALFVEFHKRGMAF